MPKLYTRNTWVDEVLAGAELYNISGSATNLSNVDIHLATAVNVTGTLVNATRMNNIENGIDALDNALLSGTFSPVHELNYISGLKMGFISSGTMSVSSGKCMSQSGALYYATGTIQISLAGLSSGTFHHLYMYGNNLFELSTTAPVTNPYLGTARGKTGDTTRRYIGSVRTYAVGSIYEFIHDPQTNLITYNGSTAVGNSPHRALNAGTATVATEVNLSAVIPGIVAKSGYLRMFNLSDKVVSFGDTTAVNGVALNIGNTAAQNFFGSAPLTATPGHYYKLASAAGAGGAYIDVYGYYFER